MSSMIRGPGRPEGSFNKDKAELRSQVQEAVLEFTSDRRDKLRAKLKKDHRDWSKGQIEEAVDEAQPLYEEWDPVVGLSIMGADHRNKLDLRRAAMGDAAQYLRPKLKSVEHTEDPESIALQESKNELSARLVELLSAGANAKQKTAEEDSLPGQ